MKKISSTVSSNCVRRVALIGFIDTLTVYCLGTIVKKVEEGIGFLEKKFKVWTYRSGEEASNYG